MTDFLETVPPIVISEILSYLDYNTLSSYAATCIDSFLDVVHILETYHGRVFDPVLLGDDDETPEEVKERIQRFLGPFFHTIDINENTKQLNNSILEPICQGMPQITRLRIANPQVASDITLSYINEHCPNIRSLFVEGLTHMSLARVFQKNAKSSELKHLTLKQCVLGSAQVIPKDMRCLESLVLDATLSANHNNSLVSTARGNTLSWIINASQGTFRELRVVNNTSDYDVIHQMFHGVDLSSCSIETLELGSLPNDSPVLIWSSLVALPHLKHLILTLCSPTNLNEIVKRQGPNLKTLKLNACGVDEHILELIAQYCRSLDTLGISGFRGSFDKAIEILQETNLSNHLQELDISRIELDPIIDLSPIIDNVYSMWRNLSVLTVKPRPCKETRTSTFKRKMHQMKQKAKQKTQGRLMIITDGN
eukprot:gb/GECH01000493.1/.p1 GENE.gb/GECH01000493.1/~~gb/GECH01000493.1/.p1  ORF type:complete len:424 (+),score=72.77 gb/GECH01000493.1/:1-1272(+)